MRLFCCRRLVRDLEREEGRGERVSRSSRSSDFEGMWFILSFVFFLIRDFHWLFVIGGKC
jgi:hypothetical protein